MRSVPLLLAAVSLTACSYNVDPARLPSSTSAVVVPEAVATPVPAPTASPYQNVDTPSLCQAYRDPQVDARIRSAIEVALVQRGEKFCGGANIGMSSIIRMGRQRYDRLEPATPGQSNCGRYASGADAQKAFLLAGGPERDPDLLDRDGDGLACGWGDELKEIATSTPE